MNKLAIVLLSALVFVQYFVYTEPVKNPVKEMHNVSVTVKYGGGNGSGVIQQYGGDVYVWTANHVVKSKIPIQLPIEVVQDIYHKGENTEIFYFKAEILARSEKYDLAILKLKHSSFFKHSARLYKDKEPPQPGEDVWGVGSPYGEANSHTTIKGIFSQSDRTVNDVTVDQVDCSVAPGCSGGGIFLNDGRLIGLMVSMKDNNMAYIVPARVMIEFAKTTKLPKALYE